jgi:hypothetical protein
MGRLYPTLQRGYYFQKLKGPTLLNNIGLPGILLILIIVVLPIWLISRASKRRSMEQARIADALEKIANNDESAK